MHLAESAQPAGHARKQIQEGDGRGLSHLFLARGNRSVKACILPAVAELLFQVIDFSRGASSYVQTVWQPTYFFHGSVLELAGRVVREVSTQPRLNGPRAWKMAKGSVQARKVHQLECTSNPGVFLLFAIIIPFCLDDPGLGKGA